ncbi:MAG: GNAT family N-acetyltransferase, partial [Flavobacterium sp.]
MIKPLTTAYLSQALEGLDMVKNHMIQQGLDQWDDHYPNQETLTADLNSQQAYIYLEHGTILAYMVLNEEYDIEYDDLVWSTKTPFLV